MKMARKESLYPAGFVFNKVWFFTSPLLSLQPLLWLESTRGVETRVIVALRLLPCVSPRSWPAPSVWWPRPCSGCRVSYKILIWITFERNIYMFQWKQMESYSLTPCFSAMTHLRLSPAWSAQETVMVKFFKNQMKHECKTQWKSRKGWYRNQCWFHFYQQKQEKNSNMRNLGIKFLLSQWPVSLGRGRDGSDAKDCRALIKKGEALQKWIPFSELNISLLIFFILNSFSRGNGYFIRHRLDIPSHYTVNRTDSVLKLGKQES